MAPLVGFKTCLVPAPSVRGTRTANLLLTATSAASAIHAGCGARSSRHSESPLMSALLHSNGVREVLDAWAEGHPMRAASHCPASALVSVTATCVSGTSKPNRNRPSTSSMESAAIW